MPLGDDLEFFADFKAATIGATSVVDLGCGPGNSTAALLSTFPGARITGVDASADMLAKARATLPSGSDARRPCHASHAL